MALNFTIRLLRIPHLEGKLPLQKFTPYPTPPWWRSTGAASFLLNKMKFLNWSPRFALQSSWHNAIWREPILFIHLSKTASTTDQLLPPKECVALPEASRQSISFWIKKRRRSIDRKMGSWTSSRLTSLSYLSNLIVTTRSPITSNRSSLLMIYLLEFVHHI